MWGNTLVSSFLAFLWSKEGNSKKKKKIANLDGTAEQAGPWSGILGSCSILVTFFQPEQNGTENDGEGLMHPIKAFFFWKTIFYSCYKDEA